MAASSVSCDVAKNALEPVSGTEVAVPGVVMVTVPARRVTSALCSWWSLVKPSAVLTATLAVLIAKLTILIVTPAVLLPCLGNPHCQLAVLSPPPLVELVSYTYNGTTQTLSLDHTSGDQAEFNQNSVDDCLRIVDDFKRGTIEKGDVLLEIQTILQSAITVSDSLSQLNFKLGFKHFLDLLNHVASNNEPRQGCLQSDVEKEGGDDHQSSESKSVSKEEKLRSRLRRQERSEEAESNESGDEHEIIDFNKACRLKVEGQKYLRFDSVTDFRQLEISHLSSLGMVAFSEIQQLSTMGGSGKEPGVGKKSG
ncbi:hypothetical protein EDB19DRAFT_1840311 [Suillus lakei]|nr:hypothetical protein EDB19DRAFT_1840311 [Suillus lakei]